MDRFGNSILKLLLTVAKNMVYGVDSPSIVAITLNTCRRYHVSLFVHCCNVRDFLKGPSSWVQKFFSINLLARGNAKFESISLSFLWHLIFPFVTTA